MGKLLSMKTRLLFVFAFLVFQNSFAHATSIVDPVAPILSPLIYCDPNNDGFGEFDLTAQNALILSAQSGSPSDYEVLYFETPSFSDDGIDISSPYNNITVWNQTIYYRIRNVNTNSYADGYLVLNVNPRPEATTPSDYHLCNSSGIAGTETFNLSTTIPEILGSLDPTSVSVSFYLTQSNAENGLSPLANNFTNYTSWQETVYVRVTSNSTGCYSVVPLSLVVDPLPQSIQPNYPQYDLCDTNLLGVGYEAFDLTSRINSILLGQIGMSVSFYPSLGDAQNNTDEIINPSSYVNMTPYVQTLGIRIINMTTGCYVISTMDIRVNPLPQLVIPTPYEVCDDNQDGITTFDLTSLIPGLTQGADYSMTFHETQMDAEVNGTTIPSPVNYMNIDPYTQIIYARAQDQNTYCVAIVPVKLQVNPSPVATVVPNLVVCDQDTNTQNGITAFDLTQQTIAILAQQPLAASNYTVTFYQSEAMAFAGSAAIIPTVNYVGSNGETIWFRVENNATHCYNIGSFQLIVNSPMLLTTPTPLQVCDSDANPNNQYTTFDLTVKSSEIVQGSPSATVTYYPSFSAALTDTNPIVNPTAYVNLNPSVQTLGVRVMTSSGCLSITTLDIRVLPIPVPNVNPPALKACDADGNGSEVFNLTVNNTYIGNGDPTVAFHYYNTLSDAEASINEIINPTAYTSSGGTIRIRVENNRVDYQGNHCYVIVSQNLSVVSSLTPSIYALSNSICVDYITGTVIRPLTLQTNIGNPSAFTFEWYEAADPNTVIGTSPTFTVDTPAPGATSRYYSVVVTSTTSSGCNGTASPYQVLQSGPATPPFGSSGYTVANLSGVQSITVNIVGYGNYEYSLDIGPHQASNVFENVPIGSHTVRIWDIEGNCSPLIINNIGISTSQVDAPTGLNSQTLPPGSTLADIVVNGTNIQWYSTATNRSATATPLPLNTILVDSMTYYATQTVGGVESTAYLPVTVHLSLGIDNNETFPIRYAPNPVKNVLTLQSSQVLKSVRVYSMLGQKVFEQEYSDTNISIDLSNLTSGNYILKAEGETGQKTIRIVKE